MELPREPPQILRGVFKAEGSRSSMQGVTAFHFNKPSTLPRRNLLSISVRFSPSICTSSSDFFSESFT
ncbi:hypothetical protein NC652_040001 [Populus alba x Populus x berolinensis]|uniref:Uncharacterized protein n=1 Tax=Populus alba x Populus x berolinensis TaxID=444605 RepID=A0AAD6LCL8_9ROSI|nr:hypothetical protein NC652_040001 [Populus alba x Populus x berolinensis]KAJ6958207.1 hypothetical protein NC653_039991 [Populus alba x Populus x berolinensis]